jgi:hypothetical protein
VSGPAFVAVPETKFLNVTIVLIVTMFVIVTIVLIVTIVVIVIYCFDVPVIVKRPVLNCFIQIINLFN